MSGVFLAFCSRYVCRDPGEQDPMGVIREFFPPGLFPYRISGIRVDATRVSFPRGPAGVFRVSALFLQA